MNDWRDYAFAVTLAVLFCWFLVLVATVFFADHDSWRQLETQRALCEQYEGVLLDGPSGPHCIMLEAILGTTAEEMR